MSLKTILLSFCLFLVACVAYGQQAYSQRTIAFCAAAPEAYGIDRYDRDLYSNTYSNRYDGYTDLSTAIENIAVETNEVSKNEDLLEMNIAGATTIINNVVASKMVVTISPNQAADFALISFSAPVTGNTDIQILNMAGQNVYGTAIGMQQTGSIAIPISDMAQGAYVVALYCGEEMVTKRFIKL